MEVKGRAGTQSVELTVNEWAQAVNHRDRYWLHVVYHCDAVRVKVSDVMAAAEAPSPKAG